jgi:ABC-type antimicrobial peptide transport system permease subunit
MRSGRGAETVEVVGVTGNVRYESLDAVVRPEIYRPLAQTFMFPMAFVVRASGEPAQIAGAVRAAAQAIDPSIPVAELQPLTAVIAGTLARPRLVTMLLGVFAGAGLLLTMVGVYGAVAYQVRQHEREFGIRLALGATPRRIVGGVLRQGSALSALGTALAIGPALGSARLMQSMIYGIAARDPFTFVLLPAAVTIVTLAASYVPARRASRVDPATAMRGE